jgi:hypothetical protein
MKKNEPLSSSPAAQVVLGPGGEPSLCATVTLFVAIQSQDSPDFDKLLSLQEHTKKLSNLIDGRVR